MRDFLRGDLLMKICIFSVFPFFFSILGVRFPFSTFVCDVLSAVNIAPTQLAPNSWAFLRCFEILADYLRFTPTHKLFLALYRVDGSASVKHGFVNFAARKSLQLFEQCKSNWKNKTFFKVIETDDVPDLMMHYD